MKILVTGSTGFVGSHLCDALSQEGHEVFALARNLKKFEEFNVQGTPIKGSLSPDEMHTWIEELPANLDAVVHTAGLVHSFNHQDFYDINSRVTLRLIEDLKKRYPKLKFIHLSSLAASGPTQGTQPKRESEKEIPVSHYGKSKLESENYLKKYAPELWDIVILRPPMVIGPRDPAVLDIFKMVKGKNILVTGLEGKNKRYSFICVHDLVQIILKALKTQSSASQNVYFTAHEQVITFDELVNEIKDQMGINKLRYIPIPNTMIMLLSHALFYVNKFYPHSLRLTPDKYQEMAPEAWVCSGKKASVEFDFDYNWNLKKTIELTLKDYQQREWL